MVSVSFLAAILVAAAFGSLFRGNGQAAALCIILAAFSAGGVGFLSKPDVRDYFKPRAQDTADR
jgi:hypothetical protein